MKSKNKIIDEEKPKRKNKTFCKEDGCIKYPNFNIKGEIKALYCSEHKKENMIDIKHRQCFEENCIKRPHFNIVGKTQGLYCFTHKKHIF